MKDIIEIKVIKISRSEQYTREADNVAASGDPLKIQNISIINKVQERLVR